MNRIWVLILLVVIICANIYWFAILKRVESKVDYHATHICELERNIKLNKIFAAGTSIDKLTKICDAKGLKCEKEGNLVKIDFDISPCPISGRPYCGFLVHSNSTTVVSVESGYPCH